MAMNFRDHVRGHMAQGLVAMLFERGGFRVTRLGIEDVFAEIKMLDQQDYLALRLPDNLRSLPDLLIADRELTTARMVEVKYRSNWNKDTMRLLHADLVKQRKHWPDSYTIVIRGDTASGLRFHQDFMRVIPPCKSDKPLEILNLLVYQDQPKQDDDSCPTFSSEDIWGMLHTLNTFGESTAWRDVLNNETHIARFIRGLASA